MRQSFAVQGNGRSDRSTRAFQAEAIHPGDVVAGKYRVRTILGRSHGLLLEAFHTEFDQRVVVKVLLAGAGDDREIERFRREARTLAKLESEHVARILDVGNHEDGSFYLVRQFIEGTDMATRLRKTGPLHLEDAVLLVLQAAEAVAETHSHGIILRELQPSHLFLTQRVGGTPLVKIADFGTAKLMRDAAAPTAGGELTATAMFGLSPYSSPELLRKAKNVDARTDVWSLGAVLYELLAGRPPFQGEMASLMLQIAKEPHAPLTEIRSDLPAEIDQIISWALAKDVDGRFANVHAFAHALTPFASAEGRVLIERIAQITQAAKQRKRAGSVPPPAPRAAPERLEAQLHQEAASSKDLDAPSTTRSHSRVVSPWSEHGTGSLHPSSEMPPPPPSQPAPPWSTSSPYAAINAEGFARSSNASWTISASNLPESVPPIAGKPPIDRRIFFGALGAAASILTALSVVLLMRVPSAGDASKLTSAAGRPAERPDSAQISVGAAAVQEPAVKSSTPAPVVAAEQPSKASKPARSSGSSSGSGSVSVKTSAVSEPRPAAPLPEPPAPRTTAASAGADGVLVAVAVGGSCAFSVNGASKGNQSTLRVPLKPGSYAVTCKPASGAAKSRSVTVKSGETAMAMFKLK
jgi:eukaryotic-like serine/threonine-protein kinase